MKNRIILLSFMAGIFYLFFSFVFAEEQSGNALPPGLADILPKGEAGKDFQKKMQDAALKIEKKCDEFKDDNKKFSECVQQYASEAAQSLRQYLPQALVNKNPDELLKANKDALEQANKIQHTGNKDKVDLLKSGTLDK